MNMFDDHWNKFVSEAHLHRFCDEHADFLKDIFMMGVIRGIESTFLSGKNNGGIEAVIKDMREVMAEIKIEFGGENE